MTENKMIQEYEGVYNRVRSLVQDDEIYPKMDSNAFKELVSPKEWFAVPSFELTLENVKKSDKGHITFRIKDNKIIADLIFHKTAAVRRFMNILDLNSKKELDLLKNFLGKLDKNYKIVCQYDTIFIDSPPDWKVFKEFDCSEMNENKIDKVFNAIKELIEYREEIQKKLEPNFKATISVLVGRTELTLNSSDSELREAFISLAQLTRITHNLKSNKELNRQVRERKRAEEKELPNLIKEKENLIKEISGDESFGISSGMTTKEATEKKKEKLKEVEKRIKDIEEGRTSERRKDNIEDIEEEDEDDGDLEEYEEEEEN